MTISNQKIPESTYFTSVNFIYLYIKMYNTQLYLTKYLTNYTNYYCSEN